MAQKTKKSTNVTSINIKQLAISPPTAKTQEQKAVFKSFNENIVSIITGPAGTGKAARLSSEVFTPNGPVEMGNLRIGDQICSPNGGTTTVLDIFPQGKIDYYKITFADGDSVEACGNHLWEVRDRDKLKKKYKTDKRVYTTLYMMSKINNSGGKNRFSIPTPRALKIKSQKVKIDPYVLGCLIGDGGFTGTGISLTSADSELVAECNKYIDKENYSFVKQSSNDYGYGLSRKIKNGRNNYIEHLEYYGLYGLKSEDKFIPNEYKVNDKSKRLAIIQGLMDTDGTVSKKSGMTTFSTSSLRLAKDFKWIIETLGGICVIKEKTTNHKINYVCHIRYNKTKDLFRLNRKKRIAKNRTKYKTKRVIRKIEKAGQDFCQCIKVSSADSLYIMDHCVVTHNTFCSVSQALYEFSKGSYDKLIFTRPAVEAYGEHLGYLPGSANDKLAPYMMPIMDIMEDYLDENLISQLIKKNHIQTIPMAFQRGLAQPLDAEVITDNGLSKFKDLKIGDKVVGSDGKIIKIDGVFDRGELDVYRIDFSDGTSTECSEDHLWITKTLNDKKYDRDFSVKSTREIKGSLKTKSGQCDHEIPIISNPILFSEKQLPIKPYLLGILIGDGCMHKKASLTIATKDLEIINNIAEEIPNNMVIKYASGYNYRIVSKNSWNSKTNYLKKSIKEIGLLGSKSHNKFIPDIYKFNSIENRLEILRGLMDTDGYIYKTSKNGKNRIEFSTTSENLCNDVMFLVQSLGGICYKRKRELEVNKKIKMKNGHMINKKYPSYILDISIFDYNIFKLSRKSEKFSYNKSNNRRRPKRIIKNISFIGKKQCRCISVDAKDNLYLTNDCIVTHNTFKNAFIVFDEAQNCKRDQMRMFLTRIGENCKVAITGDLRQTDRQGGVNGLMDASKRLKDLDNVGIINLTDKSIVRSKLVADIEARYNADDELD